MKRMGGSRRLTVAWRRPPTWIMGLGNLPLGLSNGLMLSAVPQVLAARGVAETTVADITALGLVPGFAAFLAGPLLDRRFSRRTYAIAATIVTALAEAGAVLALANPVLLGLFVFVASAASSVNMIAMGGWFGSIVDADEDAPLGTWMAVAYTLAFALVAVAALPILHALPPILAAPVLAVPNLAALLVFAALPAMPPDPSLARDRFATFLGRVLRLLRQPRIMRLVLLFALPTGSFALTNALPGLGADYHASERFVAILNGAVVTATGLCGSLLVPPLIRRAATWPLYLGTGILGAACTLALALAPHTPATYAALMVAENLAQAVTLTVATVAALQSLDHDAPLAATQFGLITSVPQLPVTYMQWLDGHAYGAGGLRAMYAADAVLGLAACVLMAALARRWRVSPAVVAPVRPGGAADP